MRARTIAFFVVFAAIAVAGLKQADNIHLTAEGHKQVAQNLLSSVAAGLR